MFLHFLSNPRDMQIFWKVSLSTWSEKSSWQAKICVWASPIWWFNGSSNWEQKQSLEHVLLCHNRNLMITRKHIQKWKVIHYLTVVLHPKYDLAFIQMKGCTYRVKPDWWHGLYRMEGPLIFSSEMKWFMFWATCPPITLEIRGVVRWIELMELLGFMTEPIKNWQFSEAITKYGFCSLVPVH
jgi:hypothetical protein